MCASLPPHVKGLPEGERRVDPVWIHYFRRMKRVLVASVGAALLIAAGLFACALLPERYAVNAPMLNMMSGWFGASAPSQDQFGARLRVPAGFSVGLFAEKLPSVRFLRPLPGGGLLATTPREGKVWLLTPDRDGDGRADAARPLIEQLNRPHGMDLLGDWLYVAEGDGVGRVRIDPETGERRGALRARGRWPSGGGESLDAHRSLRARRMDVRLRRLELQRVRRVRRSPCGDAAISPGWSRAADLRHWPAQQRRASIGNRERMPSTRPTMGAIC